MNDLNKYTSTKFLTGIKGYAALGIFLIHSGGGGLRDLSHFFNYMIEKGKYGIIPFFIISAFTISMSLDRSMKTGKFTYKNYLLRRWLKVFPLFFIIALFAVYLGGQEYYFTFFNAKNNLVNFLAEISLVNILLIRHRNNLMGVEWALSLEFFYYFLFPILYVMLSKMKKYKILYVLFILLAFFISWYSKEIISPLFSKNVNLFLLRLPFGSFITTQILNPNYIGSSNSWGALKYFFVFVSGFFLFFTFKSKTFTNVLSSISEIVKNSIFIIILVGGFLFIVESLDNVEFIVTIYTSLLIIFSFHRGFPVRLVFENPFILYMGKISYSFYLIHFLVLGAMKQFTPILNVSVSLCITILLSSMTYILIEKRFAQLSEKLTHVSLY